MTDLAKIASFKEDLDSSEHVVFLTGAGISTHSGIPDYRSKSGIYNGISEPPETILSQDTLYGRPELFHSFVMKNMYFPQAKPNKIHEKIAQICNEKGDLITQNIDLLDKKAGNKHVLEFHGNLYDIYCTKCQEKVDYQAYKEDFRHENCGGIIRPGIVLYGEAINPETLTKSVEIMRKSDLVVIAGTSFVVYPFAQLLAYRNPAAKIWLINKTSIPATGISEIIGDALEVFDRL